MEGEHGIQGASTARIGVAFIINITYSIILLVAGILGGSLAIISNGEHSIADSFSFVIAYAAAKVSRKEANPKHTYGYGLSIYISAFTNAAVLIGFAILVFYFGYFRIVHPLPTSGNVIIATSAVGIGVSGFIILLLRRGENDLNVKSLALHLTIDAMTFTGSIVAGILILVTRNYIFDPLISFFVGFVMIFTAYGIIRDSIHALLEGVPPWIELNTVRSAIQKAPNVVGIHDLHVWQLSSRETALSCHITMKNCTLEECTNLVSGIKSDLKSRFGISHATIESELDTSHLAHEELRISQNHD